MPNTSNHFISPLALSSLDGIIGVTLNSIVAYEFSGWSVASAGDVNGDGIDDVLINAYDAFPYATYLVFGHTGAWDTSLDLSSLNGINGVVIPGIASDNTGWSVAIAGDMNGDGVSDVLIGAPLASPGNLTNAGSSYLIFGHRGIWSSPLALGSLNGTNGVVINGIAAGDNSGWSVASAGDVNGDGIDDVVIGAPYASPGNVTNVGSTYLIFGHAGTWNSTLELGSLNGTAGIVINGIAVGDLSGWSVATARDMNGDAISDVLIGAFGALPCGTGSAYLIFGHTGAWGTPLALGSLNGINGVVIIAADGDSGFSVASAGDVNGDGFNDVMISSPFNSASSTYLIFGHTGTWSSPLVLGSLNGINGVVINGAGDRSGWSVAPAGDVNGDGIGDMLIGATHASPGGLTQAGSTYLIFGHIGAWSSPLKLGSLNGINGVVIPGIAAGDKNGYSVAFGDVNGDGLSDVLIGAPFASPGNLTAAGSTYLVFGDSLALLSNTLTINQGQTIFLNSSMLAAVHPHNLAINGSIPFSITNVAHGTFSTLNFLQSELSQQLVSFTHDGSIYPPSYEVTAGNWAITSPEAAIINFYAAPILYINVLSIGQGQTVVLTNQSIRATSVYYPSDALMFSLSNVLHGNFVKTNTTTIENQFNQSVLTQGQIAFATDGSTNAPSYDISVSDGRITLPAVSGTVNFNTAPLLFNNQLTLMPGQQKVLLSSNDLSANDTAIPWGKLIFTPSTLNCHFENLNIPGTAASFFLQENVQGNQIIFVWDGHSLPAYNMSVSDGVLSTGRPALITITPVQNTNSPGTEATNSGAIIGGVISTVIGLGLLFGLQWYLKKRTTDQFQRVLLEGASEAEKAFNRDVVRPITHKIFDVINTTGCFGQRTEADTKAYMMAIGKIVSELRRQNANLDLNAMEPIDKESFLNEIASQTRQQSLPKHKGFFGNCTRYFKAEVTPQEIEYAAESIALASATWQRRHMGGVSAKSTHLGIELGKLSGIGFPIEAANEGVVPPEKQFNFMQNHVKAVEQRAQETKFEEQVGPQEAELESFRRQSFIGSAS